MNRKRNLSLGLHTLEEQSIALRMALDAFDTAVKATEASNRDAFFVWTGYILGIRDMAMAESAEGLRKDLDRLVARLTDVQAGQGW